MDKRTSQKKNPSAEIMSSTQKGRIVEQIVAAMHKYPDLNVKVECNKYLPPVNRKGKKREIDILLTGTLSGYPVQMAIECKNEKRLIDSPAIEAFYSKLRHIGIPPQYGIFVSASGYTADAIENAKVDGIKTFTLRNFTEKAFTSTIVDAFESIIYLFTQVIYTTLCTPGSNDTVRQLHFYDKEGNICGSVFDLVWQKWLEGEPSSLGPHELKLTPPLGWHHMVDGKVVPVLSLVAVVDVSALVATRQGQAEGEIYSLIDASSTLR